MTMAEMAEMIPVRCEECEKILGWREDNDEWAPEVYCTEDIEGAHPLGQPLPQPADLDGSPD
jgi:hypothetical protein